MEPTISLRSAPRRRAGFTLADLPTLARVAYVVEGGGAVMDATIDAVLDPQRDFILLQAEFLHQSSVRACFLDGIQILSLNVFDQRDCVFCKRVGERH